MKWADCYEAFWEQDARGQIGRIPMISDFPDSAEAAELAMSICDEQASSLLIRRAMQHGLRFTPEDILQFGSFVDGETLAAALRERRGEFSPEQFGELEIFCTDEALLCAVARAGGLSRSFRPPEGASLVLSRELRAPRPLSPARKEKMRR